MQAVLDSSVRDVAASPYMRDKANGVYYRPGAAAFRYNDGDAVEERIRRAVFSADDLSVGSPELAAAVRDWPTRYHLSPERANLLRPIEHLLRNRSVLELGAGCGAISRYLAEIGCRLTAVEGSARRAAIAAARCRDIDGVRIVNDNFQRFETAERFDVVTLIGVLEYSRTYLHGDDPVAEALALARSFLKDDGVLVVAIENKLGLKYWAGAPEDHLGIPFCGVESLYGERTAVTFGRRELDEILRRAGFVQTEFLFPFPDYKLPHVVLTEAAIQGPSDWLLNLLTGCAAPNQGADYRRTLSEAAAYRALVQNGLVGEMANSFLVLARGQPSICRDDRTSVAFSYSRGRRRDLGVEIRIERCPQGLQVRRRLLHAQSSPSWMHTTLVEELLPGELHFNALLAVVNRAGWTVTDVARWMQPLVDYLRPHCSDIGGRPTLPGHFLDATPFNFIGKAGQWALFDLEWSPWERVELTHVLFRGVFHSLLRIGSVAKPGTGTPVRVVDVAAAVVRSLTSAPFDTAGFVDLELELQTRVLNVAPSRKAFEAAMSVRGDEPMGATSPPLAKSSAASRPVGELRLAAVLHLFYPALWSEFREALAELPPQTRVFVTTPYDRLAWVRRIVATDFPAAIVIGVENRGRDIGPLITLLEQHDLSQYDYVLKVHTKKSPHLGEALGACWRRSLLQQLLPAGRVSALLHALEAMPDVGIAGPPQWLTRVRQAIGVDVNRPHMESLARRIGEAGAVFDHEFVAGAMFWARGSVFGQLARLGLRQGDFEAESGQLDGTLAHALERMLPVVARRAGLRTAALPAVGGDGVPKVAGTSPALAEWLEARRPTQVQAAQIRERLRSHPAAPRVTVFVRDRCGNTAAVRATCDSLQGVTSLAPGLDVVVVGADAGADLPGTPRGESTTGDAIIDAINEAVRHGDAGWVMIVDAGDIFTQPGLARVMLELAESPGCRAVYADVVVRAANGSLGAAFRPAMNLDLLLSFPPAMASHWLFRRDVWLAHGGLDPARGRAAEFDLVLRLVESDGLAGLGHVGEPIIVTPAPSAGDDVDEVAVLQAHLQRRGYERARVQARGPRQYRIEYGHASQPFVSIIVPTKDQLPMLRRCVESLLEKTRYPYYELLIVDNGSTEPDARAWLDGVAAMDEERVRVLSYPHPFNFSAINNFAARHARGEYLVLLNNDTAVLDGEWLDAMLNHAQRPEVGIVGAKLLYPDGRIQHAGVVLGLRGPAEHPMLGMPHDAPGYMQRLRLDQNYSTVTAACLMIRKAVYDAVGGMDEETFKVSYNDVDLCLKTGAAGYLTVWTPDAVLLHEGSVSQKQVDTASQEARRQRFVAEQDALYAKWLPQIAHDPAYNDNLALTGPGFDFEADVALTYRPLPWRPLPVVLAHAADRHGCGEYRIIQPLNALTAAQRIDGVLRDEPLLLAEAARLDPDVIVFQRQVGERRLDAMRRLRTFTRAFKVYELDDYLPNLPLKSAFRAGIPKDAAQQLRRGLAFVDRFVVSTPALAEAFAGWHPDIHVVENRLLPAWWKGLESRRRRGRKPRVGWAGGAGHGGDLELIVDVVKALAGEVEWVFFGLCPDALLDAVNEVHAGVAIEKYPAKLASMDLDVALAPLEVNLFNECKSNLRLLEYGACGFPVICSDVRCYQGHDLPVTRVKNRFKDWVDAIRSHTHDLDEAARLGDALRDAVLGRWMLDEAHLQRWQEAWTAG